MRVKTEQAAHIRSSRSVCYHQRCMAAQTIADVISALDTIVQQSYDNASRLGYFAALYRRVTCAVRDGLSSGRFSNGPLMEQLDVVFASRYLDALATFQAGKAATRSWMLAFRGCDDANLLILQQLLSGMNAHINLDLGIAAAQTCPGDQLPQLKPDFDEINNVSGGPGRHRPNRDSRRFSPDRRSGKDRPARRNLRHQLQYPGRARHRLVHRPAPGRRTFLLARCHH